MILQMLQVLRDDAGLPDGGPKCWEVWAWTGRMTADPIGCHATESAGALAALAALPALQAWDVARSALTCHSLLVRQD